MIKIYPFMNYEELKSHLGEKWLFTEDGQIKDFWNLVHSLVGAYKLKRILNSITSAKWAWEFNPSLPLKNIRFTTNLNGIEISGKSQEEVLEVCSANNYQPSSSYYPTEESLKRLEDPIIVYKKGDGFEVHDGNGRLFTKLFQDKTTIAAFVRNEIGSGEGNPWVPTSTIISMFYDNDRLGLVRVLKRSQNAQKDFFEEIPDGDPQKELFIKYWNYLKVLNKMSFLLGAIPSYLTRRFLSR
jgi:hypothetical protein